MDEYNYLLILVIIMLFAIAIMDVISLFMVKSGNVDIDEYATAVLKWPKVILLGLFGIAMLYYAFTTEATPLTLVGELVSGVLVIADSIVGAVIKVKYGKKK